MTSFCARPDHGVAWITGASSGIGRALALKLAGGGWRVAASARSADALAELEADGTVPPGSVRSFPLDVTDRQATEETVRSIEDSFGPIALCVLNAGIYLPMDGVNPTTEIFDRTFAVNLGGTTNCLVPVIDAMKRQGRGQVALVSSVAGYGGLPTSAAYGASKAGLINLAESLKFDLDRVGIRIMVVNPGFVDTPATADNPFPMPALMAVDAAAQRIVDGLERPGFEITFPRRFTYGLKLVNLLPYRLYFRVIDRFTGWSKRSG